MHDREDGQVLEFAPVASPTGVDARERRTRDEVDRILTRDERVLAVAVQARLASPVRRDAAIVTNRRVILFRPKMLGRMSMQDFLWQDIEEVRVRTNLLGAAISVRGERRRRDGSIEPLHGELGGLRKEQALSLYAKAQEMEESWRERSRIRNIEEERARAGGVFVSQAPVAPAPVPVPSASAQQLPAATPVGPDSIESRLQRLKRLHEQGLIEDAEFEAKKAQIVSEL